MRESLFIVTDPLGCQVTLYTATWYRHIVVRHPEMREMLEGVRATVERPMVIQQAADRPSVSYYYRLTGSSFYKYRDVYVSVVVDRQGQIGTVKTAHLIRELRPRAKDILWLERR